MKLSASINLRKLRTDASGWEWSAERLGMGWRYIGTRDKQRVTVYAVSMLGLFDDCETVWLVDDGKASTNYYSWQMMNSGTDAGVTYHPVR